MSGIHREAAALYQVEEDAAFTAVDLGFGKYGLYVPGSDSSHHENYTISTFRSNAEHAVEVVVDGKPVGMIINHLGASVRQTSNDPVIMQLTSTTPAGLFDFMDYYEVTLMNPKVLVGIFSGVLMVFVFGAMTMKAVGRAAMAMVMEVRRQFREMPGIMEGTTTPDYARCVAISTAGAQREMIRPSLLAVLAPVLVGLLLGVAGVMGLLVGGLCAGFAMAVFMANAGGAWDNAKKLIETGQYGGKGSDAHKSSVVGDTVGDPFKDTTGPSLNILIKLMNMVSIVFAGLVVKFAPEIASFLGMGQ